jgi:hypothetical protein
MCKQCGLLLSVERRESVPYVAFILGQAGFPPIVPGVDGFCRSALLACAGNVGVRIAISRQLLDDAKR